MAEEEVILLSFWASPFGMRVRIALEEKGIKYDYREEDLRNKSSMLLQMNPVHKKIPVLVHKGKPICESLIAVEYIDEVWTQSPSIFPSDPYLRSQARFWAEYADKKIYEVGKKVGTTRGEEQEAARNEFIECLKLLEVQLGEKPYFGGENFGFVDITIIPFYSWFKAYDSCGNLNVEAECPRFIAWAKRRMQRQSVSTSLPDQQKVYEFVSKMMKLVRIQ